MAKTKQLHIIYAWTSPSDVPCDHLVRSTLTQDLWLDDSYISKEHGEYAISFTRLKQMIEEDHTDLVNPILVLDFRDDCSYYGGQYIEGYKIVHEVPESESQFATRKLQYQNAQFKLNEDNKKRNATMTKQEEKERKEYERLKKIYG